MANRHGQGIGGVGARGTGQAEQHPNHVLDLILFRLPVPDNRLFYRPGAIVEDSQPVLHGGDYRSPPGVAEF
jgi:hypothetical protein